MDAAEVVLPPCVIEQISSPLCRNADAGKAEIPVAARKPCPWGKSSSTDIVSFNDVMSEQLASVLQKEEEQAAYPERFIDVPPDIASDNNQDTCDDLLLAQMLQLEFDKEHDNILKHEAKKYNGASKVSVSFDKYLRVPEYSLSDDEDDFKEELLEQNAKKHWENFDQAKKALQAVGKSGISRQGNTTTTKHDIVMCGRRNACKLMEFPSGIETGDGYDISLSNNVYNTLKLHCKAEYRRSNKVHDKIEKATAEKAMDEKTRLILYKLVSGDIVESVNGCISMGKEACVYHAISAETEETPQMEYALKVYKTTLNEFQNRDLYIKDDYRFKDRFSRLNPRKVIHLWAEKEMRNLIRINRANIPCPEVVALKKHVLVMSFIGSNSMPAPKLKEIKVPFEDMMMIYEQTLDIMRKLYQVCRLVHSDLSEYNLLWHDDKVWVIDVSQAVEVTHPCALKFLLRDCENMICYFEKHGVIGALKPEALFTDICGKKFKKEDF